MSIMGRPKRRLAILSLTRGECASCCYPIATVSVARAGEDLSLLPGRLSLAVKQYGTAVPDAQAALRRPGPSGWTVLETLAHVADTLTDMVVAVEEPTLVSPAPVIDAPPAAPTLDARDALEKVSRAVGRLRSIASSVNFDGRRSVRLAGRELSASELLRRAAHEGAHHLSEIELLLPPPRLRFFVPSA